MDDDDLKDGNDKARRLYLSRPERNRGVRLAYDADQRLWLKGEPGEPLAQYFDEKRNAWRFSPGLRSV